eukprot:Protomagalhaensia_sp_Gyna_25__975@NODE_1471_length_1808_cov_20_621255_g1191_i0_p1_GENE_NODE_1471_length_1808_cov_20_621255_g1191_i0NODE_1471_length_1808_cov_20_621255_g1191_i0_p1_ORF_typecomplete_len482_score78_67Transferase/PF02458_15/8_5e50Condensation/PF00668_20/8e06DUF5351/PF17302_2/1_7e03DUF5351/PF17302_2/1_4_NODE_1471_length_1808_cov_20_621255_g1191_i02771722
MSVTRVSQQIIKPASLPPEDGPQFMGPMDKVVPPGIPIAVVFVYESASCLPTTSSAAVGASVPLLAAALSHLLDFYPQLGGRLRSGSDSCVHSLGSGAELFVAISMEPLSQFRTRSGSYTVTDLPAGGNALLPPQIWEAPLLAVQHTRFPCGAISLGIRAPHSLCDGVGYFQLVKDLASLYDQLLFNDLPPQLTQPPIVAAHLASYATSLTPTEKAKVLQFRSDHYMAGPQPETGSDPASRTVVTDPESPEMAVTRSETPVADAKMKPPSKADCVVGRVLEFKRGELERLKEASASEGAEGWVSTFEALAAHIWKHVFTARQRSGLLPAAASILVSVDVRERAHLPPRYFPNATFTPFTTVDPEVLLQSRPLAAAALHRCVRQDLKVEENCQWLALQPSVKSRLDWTQRPLLASSWTKIDIAVPLGGIPPCLVAPPFTPTSLVDGLVYFLPAVADGVSVYLALHEVLWPLLDEDPEFRQFA